MKRSSTIPIVVIVAAVVVGFAALSVKRVPPGQQGVRVVGGGAKSYGPGFHLVPPFGGSFVVYPLGAIEVRFPSEGVYQALTKSGDGAGVALELRFDIGQGTGESIYGEFGKDLQGRLSDLVRETVEIEAARWSPEGSTPEELAAAVVDEMSPALTRAGIALRAYRIAAWEGAKGGEIAAGSRFSKPLRKVIFIGVDGGDWEIIRPMIEKGHLPNFKTVIQDGATGPLRTIEPILSPLVWTTIATGKLPEEHGILSFTVVDQETGERLPITRMPRKVDALWNILGERGRTVDIIGWLATYPAEDINGFMITDRAGYLAYAGEAGKGALAPGVISPADRAAEIAKLVVKSETLEYEEFRDMLDIDRDTFEKEKVIAFDKVKPINNLIMLYATARTCHEIAKHLLVANRPDFLGVYFELCDAVGHLFMGYAPPRLEWVDEKDYEKYKDVMLNTYVLQDRMLGEMIELSDDETVIMIASDHGFKSGANRPRLSSDIDGGHAAFWHQLDGIVAFYGKGIRRGYRIEGATVLDMMPTILALQGIPQAQDMPGKVLSDVFEDSLASRVDRTVVATLESGKRREAGDVAATTGPADEQALKKLEALGYITPMNPNDYNNLGQRLQQAGEHEKAIEQFKKALAINPNFPGALNNIGVSYGRIRQYDLSEEAFKKALSIKKTDVYAMNNLAILYLETGRLDEAAEYGNMVVRTEPNYANGHLTLGSIYATAGDLDRAEKEFTKALELDPASRSAKANIEKVRAQKSQDGASRPGR